MDEVLNVIDQATEPSRMSKEGAVEFLEQLIEDIKMRIDALRDEMKEHG